MISPADEAECETLKLLDWSCFEVQALSDQMQQSSMHVCCLRKLKLVWRYLLRLAEKAGYEMPRLLVWRRPDVQKVPDPGQYLVSRAWCLGKRLHVLQGCLWSFAEQAEVDVQM